VTAFELLVAAVGVLAGGVASIAGFGVGSLLTPLLTPAYGAKLGVALVAIPHAVATLLRLWHLRAEISWRVVGSFGLTSAIGGLTGAYVFTQAPAGLLARTLGALLIAVGLAETAGVTQRLRFRGAVAWIAGAISGLFGGMVGNQGGVRSAGLLGFGLSPRAFVATAAAIALLVDLVRVPIYVHAQGPEMLAAWRIMLWSTIGVSAGTFAGSAMLFRLPTTIFRRVVGVVLLILGSWLLAFQ
jgi:uncharacterized membrane protein YfcA